MVPSRPARCFSADNYYYYYYYYSTFTDYSDTDTKTLQEHFTQSIVHTLWCVICRRCGQLIVNNLPSLKLVFGFELGVELTLDAAALFLQLLDRLTGSDHVCTQPRRHVVFLDDLASQLFDSVTRRLRLVHQLSALSVEHLSVRATRNVSPSK